MLRLLLLAVIACGLGAAAWAAPTGAAPGAVPPPPVIQGQAHDVIRNPDWLRRPSGEDVANYYPRRAMMMGLQGRATIRCRVLVSGDLADCKLLKEEPKGEGFGQAALRMSRLFKMQPKTVNGQPVEGGTVTIPIRFNTDGAAWGDWALLIAIGVIVLMGLALNDAMAGAAGVRTVPVWGACAASLGFTARSLAAYPAPLLLMAAAGALDGWYSQAGGLRSPLSLLVNLMSVLVAAAGYRYAFHPLRPGDRAFRLGPLGLQFGETEARTLMANLGYGVLVLAPVIVITLAGVGVVAMLPLIIPGERSYHGLVGALLGVVAAVAMLLFLLRSWLIIPHIVFSKALELRAPWRATRGAVFSTLALLVLWVASLMVLAVAGYGAVTLLGELIADTERWANAVAEALVVTLASPLFIGAQSYAYGRLMELKPSAAASRPPLVV